jgi:hypothetical protein
MHVNKQPRALEQGSNNGTKKKVVKITEVSDFIFGGDSAFSLDVVPEPASRESHC